METKSLAADLQLARARRVFDAVAADFRMIDLLATDYQETTMTAAETITDEQIRALRVEAESLSPSDQLQVDICDVALASSEEGHEVGSGRTRTAMTRSEARAECARVIANAEAQS